MTGVYALPRLNVPGYASFEISPEVYKRLDTEQRSLADKAEARFSERMAKSTQSSEWCLVTGEPADVVTMSARYANITIVGQTDPDDQRSIPGLADDVVLNAGGPVLVWTYVGSFGVDPETIMLAWNGSRESKRALADALPLLQRASKVIVFGIDTGDGKHIPGADVSTHLARQGVNAETRTRSHRPASTPATCCCRRSAMSVPNFSSWAPTVTAVCGRFCWAERRATSCAR